MNEKKAIVFFFVVVVFFFCFSFLLLVVVVVVASSTYVVTYVFLSFVLCFGCVCVFFFSYSSFASLTCASVCSYVCDCVCVCLSISTFCCCCCCFFFGGLTVSNAALLAHFVSSFLRFYVVIRGGVFLHFFFTYRTKHVHTCTRTDTDTQTDGRTEGEKCARAASFGKHTQNYFAFFIVVCCCYYYDWLLLLFTFHGMLLGVINKQRQSALHAHTLVRGVGGTIHNFSTLPRCTFWKLASSSSATCSSSLSLFWVVSF